LLSAMFKIISCVGAVTVVTTSLISAADLGTDVSELEHSTKSDGEHPSRADAEAAVRTLIAWAGDDPDREGLRETPARVARAYEEFFSGYKENPDEILGKVFDDIEGYDDLVVLRNIRIESHCEHHIVPILGVAHVGYVPSGKVVGISKLARVVEVFARRMQTQEALTVQIAQAIDRAIEPRGVGVIVEASHQCMTTRGIRKPGVALVTSHLTGVLREDPAMRKELLSRIETRSGTQSW
jgi:GTP cyclohydrolase I